MNRTAHTDTQKDINLNCYELGQSAPQVERKRERSEFSHATVLCVWTLIPALTRFFFFYIFLITASNDWWQFSEVAGSLRHTRRRRVSLNNWPSRSLFIAQRWPTDRNQSKQNGGGIKERRRSLEGRWWEYWLTIDPFPSLLCDCVVVAPGTRLAIGTGTDPMDWPLRASQPHQSIDAECISHPPPPLLQERNLRVFKVINRARPGTALLLSSAHTGRRGKCKWHHAGRHGTALRPVTV